jgi:hypothetical protein
VNEERIAAAGLRARARALWQSARHDLGDGPDRFRVADGPAANDARPRSASARCIHHPPYRSAAGSSLGRRAVLLLPCNRAVGLRCRLTPRVVIAPANRPQRDGGKSLPDLPGARMRFRPRWARPGRAACVRRRASPRHYRSPYIQTTRRIRVPTQISDAHTSPSIRGRAPLLQLFLQAMLEAGSRSCSCYRDRRRTAAAGRAAWRESKGRLQN